MLEVSTNAAVLKAIHKAHQERSAAVQSLWNMVFRRKVSR
jgi:hypothetical protein